MKTERRLIFSLLGGARFSALTGVNIRCKDLCLIGRLKGRRYIAVLFSIKGIYFILTNRALFTTKIKLYKGYT